MVLAGCAQAAMASSMRRRMLGRAGAASSFVCATAKSSAVSQIARPRTSRQASGQISNVRGVTGKKCSVTSSAPVLRSTRRGSVERSGCGCGVEVVVGIAVICPPSVPDSGAVDTSVMPRTDPKSTAHNRIFGSYRNDPAYFSRASGSVGTSDASARSGRARRWRA